MNQDLFAAAPAAAREWLSVSQLNQRARLLLEDVFAEVGVEGEISNLARPASGHLYFSLKDSKAQVRCALFRTQAQRLRTVLRDGLMVRVQGRVSLFEGRGDFQLIVSSLAPAGDGALRLAFEALKEKLSKEGLFAAERKRALPAYPKRIGIVTSPSGAVIRDILSVLARRAPQVEAVLIPTPVQGQQAAAQIVAALELAARAPVDALILARGGGSLEDLWCFNEEAVVRAVAACSLPIVSAVGHETDVTLCDFAADLRAPTPSAAAELLAADNGELLSRVQGLSRRLHLCMQAQLAQGCAQLGGLSRRLRHPGERLRQQAQRLDELDLRLRRTLSLRMQQKSKMLAQLAARLKAQQPRQRQKLLQARLADLARRLQLGQGAQLERARARAQQLAHKLHIVSPLATLSRGYSILLDGQNHAVRRAQDVGEGQCLTAHLAEGTLVLRVESAPAQAGSD